jgi:thioredoxin 1
MSSLKVIDFYADWCGPCKVLSPMIQKLKENNPDVVIEKINVDENRELALEFSVRNIPTVIFLKGDEVVAREIGVKQESHYQNLIDENK